MRKRWVVAEGEPQVQRRLAEELGLSAITGAVLLNRGVRTVEEGRDFFDADLSSLHDPFLIPDMEEAVDRILRAGSEGEKVVIYGDFDVDGVSSVAILTRAFRALGLSSSHYLPSRLEEGYGINKEAVRRCAEGGAGLLVSVDCGTSARDEVALARDLGMEVIVTDHHEVCGDRPECLLVNPKRQDGAYPYRELAGAGVAYKLAAALLQKGRAGPAEGYLPLAALGTVADVAPLTGENRVLVKEGVGRMSDTPGEGLRALLRVAGLRGRVDGWHLAFLIAPRINASGRLSSAERALELLLTEDPFRAEALAEWLDERNRERRRIETEVFAEAVHRVGLHHDPASEAALVVAGEGWHPGVVGIVAQRLVEAYHRPALVISLQRERGKGSGRSIPGFHLLEALTACGDLLERFGGHRFAAGIEIEASAVPAFRKRFLEAAAARMDPDLLVPTVKVDCESGLREMTLGLAEELQRLAPYGVGNPRPVFVTRGVEVLEHRSLRRGALKLRVREGNSMREAICFRVPEELGEVLRGGARLDIAYKTRPSEFRGKKSLALQIVDARIAEGG